jgi:quinol monooxygenase YgiN
MVGMEILVRVKPSKRVEFLQAFQMLSPLGELEHKRVEKGLFEQIEEQVEEGNTFLWLEHWESFESLAVYFQGSRFKAMMGAIGVMGQVLNERTFSVNEENLAS